MLAASGVPADADALAEPQTLGLRAERDHGADRFVARDEGIAGHAPVVVPHRQIGMADAAVLDANLHVLAAKRTGFEFADGECRTGFGGGPGSDRGHVSLLSVVVNAASNM